MFSVAEICKSSIYIFYLAIGMIMSRLPALPEAPCCQSKATKKSQHLLDLIEMGEYLALYMCERFLIDNLESN